jgi:hypothetical protein
MSGILFLLRTILSQYNNLIIISYLLSAFDE